MRELDELRQLTAGRLLAIWRESGEAAEEPGERALLCNARVLAESCFLEGKAVFHSGDDVLAALTPREMELLLRQLAEGEAPTAAGDNPAFDRERFQALKEG